MRLNTYPIGWRGKISDGRVRVRVAGLLFLYGYGHHLYLHKRSHSFPTRRSSDLCHQWFLNTEPQIIQDLVNTGKTKLVWKDFDRSEEHTSELQSRTLISYAVF